MTTIRRRALRRRPLSRAARELLAFVDAGAIQGDPDAVIAAAGIRSDWAWSAMAMLLERGLIERGPWGHVQLTAQGRNLLRQAA